MATTADGASIHDRMLAVMQDRKPDRPPFIGRLELWRRGHIRSGTLPAQFHGLTLTEIHRAVGMGQQQFVPLFKVKLHGVELVVSFEGEELHRETNPIVDNISRGSLPMPEDRIGTMTTELITPVGKIMVQQQILMDEYQWGIGAYMIKHPFHNEADYRTAEYVLERAEYILQADELRATEARLGDIGYAVPHLGRTPFQGVLIDYFHTTGMFYALNDAPQSVERLLALLDESVTDNLHSLAALDVPYVQFGDNLDGMMTNPRLFAQYNLPAYQRYVDILHAQGKKVGVHADGNLKPILGLLAESGLDVIESFSPYPLTPCTVEEALEAWPNGPIIWGGIPSPLLESQTGEEEFRNAIAHLLDTVGDRPVILCITDMVLLINSIDRVRAIAQMVENKS